MADHHPGLEVDTRPHDQRYSDLEAVHDSDQTHAHGDHTTLSQNKKKSSLTSASQPLAYDSGLEAVHPHVGGDAGAAEHGGEPGAGKSEKKSKKGTLICGLKKQTVCIAVAILVGLFIVAIAVGVGLGVGLRSSSDSSSPSSVSNSSSSSSDTANDDPSGICPEYHDEYYTRPTDDDGYIGYVVYCERNYASEYPQYIYNSTETEDFAACIDLGANKRVSFLSYDFSNQECTLLNLTAVDLDESTGSHPVDENAASAAT